MLLLHRRVCYYCHVIFAFLNLRFGTCFVLVIRRLKNKNPGTVFGLVVQTKNADSLRANNITVGSPHAHQYDAENRIQV